MKTVWAKDFFRDYKYFNICFETTIMNEKFAVGVDTTKPNEVSIFYVMSGCGDDVYYCLNTCFWDIFEKYHFSFEEKLKKEIAKVLKDILTSKVKAGKMTIEQIERMV